MDRRVPTLRLCTVPLLLGVLCARKYFVSHSTLPRSNCCSPRRARRARRNHLSLRDMRFSSALRLPGSPHARSHALAQGLPVHVPVLASRMRQAGTRRQGKERQGRILLSPFPYSCFPLRLSDSARECFSSSSLLHVLAAGTSLSSSPLAV